MFSKLIYSKYLASFPLSEKDVIDYLVELYHPNASEKQTTFITNNLTLILEVTFKFTKNLSFSKMTVRDLQKETGISMGTLYNTFGSKEQLESMIVDGLTYIVNISSERGLKREIPQEEQIALAIKAYVYLGRMFGAWYYFVAMEFRTMTLENLKKVEDLRLDFLHTLADQSNGSLAIFSHISTIIQDYNVRYWKYKVVDIDDFADHCVKLAKVLIDNSDFIGDLPVGSVKLR